MAERVFSKCSTNSCSVELSKIHRKTPVPESHLTIFAALHAVTLLKKRPSAGVFLS